MYRFAKDKNLVAWWVYYVMSKLFGKALKDSAFKARGGYTYIFHKQNLLQQ